MSTARATPTRGLLVLIAAAAGLVVTLVLLVLAPPCCTDDVGGAPLSVAAAVDGGQPGAVVSERCSGLAPVVEAAVRPGAGTPDGVAAVAAVLAVAVAVHRSARRGDRRPSARYALCVMRT